MGTYLVVTDKAVPAPALRYGLLNFASQNKPADFVLLDVPNLLPSEPEAASLRAAREAVDGARSFLSTMGVPVVDALIYLPPLRKAIAAEIAAGRHVYAGILLAAPTTGLLRLLHFDLAHQLERKLHVPVTYVQLEAAQATPVG